MEMKRIVKCIAVATVLISSTAWSQDSDSWEWRVIPYFWGVNIDGTMAIGPIENDLDVSLSDILEDLDIGASVAGQFSKGQHGFHVDYTYLRLKPDANELPSPPFAPGSEIVPKLTINILEAGYNWLFTDAQTLVLGARYIDMEMRMAFDFTGPAPIDPDPLTAGPSWVDYFVGLQSRHHISANWGVNLYGTIGAGGSDFPWTAQATFDRKFSNKNALHLGFRVWGLDYSENKNSLNANAALDATMYGFLVGYEFN